MSPRPAILAAAIGVCAWVASPALAPVLAQQQRPQRPPAAAPAPAPAPPAAPAPGPAYEPLLLRLAEILGAVSYLADLCQSTPANPPPSATYRARMRDLIDSESQNEPLRDRLAGAFNSGFSGYQFAHVACTAASRLALERLIADGARLSREIAARFGS